MPDSAPLQQDSIETCKQCGWRVGDLIHSVDFAHAEYHPFVTALPTPIAPPSGAEGVCPDCYHPLAASPAPLSPERATKRVVHLGARHFELGALVGRENHWNEKRADGFWHYAHSKEWLDRIADDGDTIAELRSQLSAARKENERLRTAKFTKEDVEAIETVCRFAALTAPGRLPQRIADAINHLAALTSSPQETTE